MAVNVGQRNVPDTPANRQLEACQKAMDLSLHTIKIYYEELVEKLRQIETELAKIGFEINQEKTHITPLSKGFAFLGFNYRITFTGKIIMTLNSANIKHERKKLRRLVALASAGEITKAKADECFHSWCVNAAKGNSYKLLKRMRDYYDSLWRDYANQ